MKSKVSKHILRLMYEKNLSAQGLATLVGLSKFEIGRIISGVENIDKETISRIFKKIEK